MTIHSKRRASQAVQTYCLWVGLAAGYLSFLGWLGPRPIVLLSGAVIVGGTIIFWHRQLAQTTPSAPSTDLLQVEVFLNHLSFLEGQIPETVQSQWCSAQQQTLAIQQIACQIAQQEASLIPDLLETLHTVLDLIEQVSEALQVTQQVQTVHYQAVAQQRLQSSQRQLQRTHDQLQTLRDQMALERLKPSSFGISQRLKALISENETEILGD